MGRNAAKHVRGFENPYLTLDCHLRVVLAGSLQTDLVIGILDFLDHLLHGVDFHQAGFFVEVRLEVFGSLVVLPRGYKNRVFHSRDDNLGINPFVAAQLVNGLE